MKSRRNGPTGTQLAILFEGSLLLLAVVLAVFCEWSLDLPLWRRALPVSGDWGMSVLRGIVATVPMLVAFAVMVRSRWRPLVNLRLQVKHVVRSLLGRSSVAQLALLSILAGAGEEFLFRGVIQPLVAHWLGVLAGLIVASLLFGLAHCLSPLYFLLATVIGFYFGWMAIRWEEILSPAIAHALYDFVVLVYLVKRRKRTAAKTAPSVPRT